MKRHLISFSRVFLAGVLAYLISRQGAGYEYPEMLLKGAITGGVSAVLKFSYEWLITDINKTF